MSDGGKKGVIFLMNKSDLWEKGPDKEEVQKWFEQEGKTWSELPVDLSESYIFSAKRNDKYNLQKLRYDISQFIEKLSE